MFITGDVYVLLWNSSVSRVSFSKDNLCEYMKDIKKTIEKEFAETTVRLYNTTKESFMYDLDEIILYITSTSLGSYAVEFIGKSITKIDIVESYITDQL